VSYDIQGDYTYQKYNASVPAGGQPAAGALPQTEEQGGLFGEAQGTTPAAETTAPASGDIYSVDKGADTEALTQQQEAVSADVSQASSSQEYVNSQIELYEARIQRQDEYIERLEGEIAELEQSNQTLEDANRRLNLQSQSLQAQIDRLDTLIEANSGFLGTISNGINSLLGNGVDVNALRAQKAELEAKKAEIDQQIAANEETIGTNKTSVESKSASKTRTEEYKVQNEEHAAALKEQLAPLAERIENGEATLEEIKVALVAANKQSNIKVSDEDVTTAALALLNSGKKTDSDNTTQGTEGETPAEGETPIYGETPAEGEIPIYGETPAEDEIPIESITPAEGSTTGDQTGNGGLDNAINLDSNYINSASQSEDGECDNTILVDMYVSEGLTEEEAFREIEIFETLANYEEMGLALDFADINNMTAVDLDSIVESAIVQDVIKTTSTKVMSTTAFTSKKDVEANSEATDEFLSSVSALNSYYSANDVNDFEVMAFLSLSGTMQSNINQGYVYGTSDLQQMSSSAQSLLSELKTKVTAGDSASNNAEAQFIEESGKTSDTLEEIENKLGDKAADNDKLAECKIEFLNLTSNYNNAETDSEQASYIKLMQELGEKAERLEEDPESKNPYYDGSIWIAA